MSVRCPSLWWILVTCPAQSFPAHLWLHLGTVLISASPPNRPVVTPSRVKLLCSHQAIGSSSQSTFKATIGWLSVFSPASRGLVPATNEGFVHGHLTALLQAALSRLTLHGLHVGRQAVKAADDVACSLPLIRFTWSTSPQVESVSRCFGFERLRIESTRTGAVSWCG